MTTPAARSALAWLRNHAPTPSNSHETVALAIHALLLHHDFRPSDTVATETPATEPHPQPQPPSANANVNANTDDSAQHVTPSPTTLPSGWGGAGYGGQYRHHRSAMLFDIRGVRMGGRLVVHAAAGEDDTRMHTVDVRVADYVAGDATENVTETAEESWQNLVRLDDLATIVAVQLAHRLVPDSTKHGYEDSVSSDAQPSSTQGGQAVGPGAHAQPTGAHHPEMRPRLPPDSHDDPLRIGPIRQPRMPLHPGMPMPGIPGMPGMPAIPGMPYGRDDLVPPGLPSRDGLFQPGGNLMGPGHFRPGLGGPGTGGLPPGVPPGARFDPIGPTPDPDMEATPGFEDEHRLRHGQPYGQMGRGGRGPFGGRGGGGLGDGGPPPGMFF